MKLSRILHHNEERIRIDFAYNPEKSALLKQIEGAKWSKTIKAWHVPYTKAAFDHLKKLFPDVEYEPANRTDVENQSENVITTVENSTEISVEKTAQNSPTTQNSESKVAAGVKLAAIEMIIYSGRISLKLPKNESDIQFIRSFKWAKWDSNSYCWHIPNIGQNVEKLKRYFGNREIQIIDYNSKEVIKPIDQPVYTASEILAINHQNKIIKVYFSYDQNFLEQLKLIFNAHWNAFDKC